ncbi:hypothetical protein MASR2M36_21860 [Providencia sp.]
MIYLINNIVNGLIFCDIYNDFLVLDRKKQNNYLQIAIIRAQAY